MSIILTLSKHYSMMITGNCGIDDLVKYINPSKEFQIGSLEEKSFVKIGNAFFIRGC